MSKRNPIYIIEIRKRINKNRNEALWMFGAFSTIEKATKHIQFNGESLIKEYSKRNKKNKLFFAILEMKIDEDDWVQPIAKIALDSKGVKTYWFSNE